MYLCLKQRDQLICFKFKAAHLFFLFFFFIHEIQQMKTIILNANTDDADIPLFL